MFATSVSNSTHELADLTVQLLWDQWRAIGGSAATRTPFSGTVDPEALVLATLSLGDREPRITDVLLSWVERNADLLSVQRLKSMQRDYPTDMHQRVSEFANTARSLAKHPKWQSLVEDRSTHVAPDMPNVRRAAQPQLMQPASLMLRVRRALGVSTKADVLTVLLGVEGPQTIRELSDALSYTRVGVRVAVTDLECAGFVVLTGGKPAAFAAPLREWTALLHLSQSPRWTPWHHWFALVADLTMWSEHAATRSLGDYAAEVKVRELLERHALFFRSAANELSASAFRSDRGSSLDVLGSLIGWVRHWRTTAAGRG